MAILSAEVKIVGIRPLLFHCFSPEVLSPQKRERTGVAGNDPEEWKHSYTATEQGQLYLDSSYMFGCLRAGAKYTKAGIGSIQPKVAATLQVMDQRVLLNRWVGDPNTVTTDQTQEIYVDVRGVKNPHTKGRNVRYRLAVSTGWEAEFSLMWENTLVNRVQMESVCIDAGQLVGVGDGRAIGFGRFRLANFEVQDAKTQTA